MILYDQDRPRPYMNTDFPSQMNAASDPVLASSSYVYALPRADTYGPGGCLVRFPVDEWGFGPAENFCDLGANWGKYPEMKIYAGTFVLENGSGAYGFRSRPGALGSFRLPTSYDAARNISVDAVQLAVDSHSAEPGYRLLLSQLDTGEPLGHYPARTLIGAFPSSALFLDNDTLLYIQEGYSVTVVPKWQTAIERYR
jgi:hypothetical protein